MRIEPLYDKILVRPLPPSDQIGSLFIPETAVEKPEIGIIEATGEGRLMESGTIIPLRVRVGDKIMFSKFAGLALKSPNSYNEYIDVLLMREDDVTAVIRS